MDRRPVIGVFVNDLVGSYQYGVWSGVEKGAKEAGCDAVSFNGGELNSAMLNKVMRNETFKLATPVDVDALIVVAPAIANALTHEEALSYIRGLAPLPVMVVGMDEPTLPCVMVDNDAGMEAVTEHVVGHHGRRHPLYLGGPLLNPEAATRRRMFLAVLERYGIEFDPRLDLVGEFDFGLGRQRILDILDQGIPFDAVVAANDEMALGAMEALRERGLRIPDDVVVTGFDDIEDASFSTPALTSVRQPVSDQGLTSIRVLLDHLRQGTPLPGKLLEPASLVARGSCGCHSASLSEGFGGHSVESIVMASPIEYAKRIARILDKPADSAQVAWLAKALHANSTPTAVEDSILAFEACLSAMSTVEDDADRWQAIISRLRRVLLPLTSQDPIALHSMETAFHQMRILAHERAVQRSSYKSTRIERWTRQLHQTGSQLITNFDVESLVETLAADLERLQLSSCHLLLREPGGDAEHLRLILSYAKGVRKPCPPEGILVDARGLVRQLVSAENETSAVAVEPLFFEATPLGFALLELAPRRGMLLDALRTQISAALMGARLAKEVRARTEELERALETLQKNQQQLVTSEKMASLGKLTAGIAHEMNTPLSAMRSSLDELGKLVQEYRDSIGDKEVNEDDHLAIATDMLKAVEIASRAGDKASKFVRSIKSQTRDMGAKDKQMFDAVHVVEETALLLSHAFRSAHCELKLDIRLKPALVTGIPDRLAQVITNLATNAIDAMEPVGGTVDLLVDGDAQEVRISVSDHGTGISQENLVRIFDPLFTTKPVGKGTGLGLTIIHDIVHGDFGGMIEVESQVGVGTTFRIRLPAVKEA
ncbi:MAG TPA: substrate-binding domain-containing protein [Fibrobacteria bacterium]|nr:substrate-binding domain-containing protein [Fibrobacteria bacterium]